MFSYLKPQEHSIDSYFTQKQLYKSVEDLLALQQMVQPTQKKIKGKEQQFIVKSKTNVKPFLTNQKEDQTIYYGNRPFLQATRLHINFRAHFFEEFPFKGFQRDRAGSVKNQFTGSSPYLQFLLKNQPFLSNQLYYLEAKRTWKYYFKQRFLLLNAGYRFRQRLIARINHYRFFFTYHAAYYPKRSKAWHRFKFFVNYRRKTLKSEKKKNALILLNNRLNYNIKKVRYRPQHFKALTIFQNRRRKVLFYLKRMRQLVGRQALPVTNAKPFWFRRGFKQWRLKKIQTARVYQNKVQDHYSTLLGIKQGLRYYYGGFRLAFLEKIYTKIKAKKQEAKLEAFITYLESCFFIVLYRANFVSHPKIAIYLMRDNHQIFYVNGRFLAYPLYQVQKGDFIGVKNRVFQKMVNRFLRAKQIPAFLYTQQTLGYGWVIQKPEVRDNITVGVLPITSIRYLVSNLKFLL